MIQHRLSKESLSRRASRRSNRNRGISLVEVMVAMGLMGGVAVLFTTFMNQSAKGQRGLASAMEFNQLVSDITLVLQKSDTCQTSLGGETATAASVRIKNPANPAGPALAEQGKRVSAGSTLSEVLIKDIVSVGGAGERLGTLRLTVSRDMSVNVGVPTMSRELRLRFKVNGANQITSCSTVGATYLRGGLYGGCYQQYNADFSLAGSAFMAWPVINCGVNPPVCDTGFTPVINHMSQGNSSTAAAGWNFLNADVYWTSWACAKI